MRLTIFIAVFGVLSILMFTFHWIFKIMHWPMSAELKIGAFALGALGLILMTIDHFVLKNRSGDNPEKPFDKE